MAIKPATQAHPFPNKLDSEVELKIEASPLKRGA
jgi:hypothetical protein